MTINPYLPMRALTILLAVLLTGCDNPLGVDIPGNAVEIEPDAHFLPNWEFVEDAVGTDADFDSVRWFRVPGESFRVDGDDVRGMWVKDGNRIYLADPVWQDVNGSKILRHEMLHAVLSDPSHDHPLFGHLHFEAPRAK